MGCTTWPAMFGNGWLIRMMPRIIRPPPHQIHWDLIRMTIACYGVVHGATPLISPVPPPGIRIFITTTQTMSTVALAFVVPGMQLPNKHSTAETIISAAFHLLAHQIDRHLVSCSACSLLLPAKCSRYTFTHLIT